MNTPLNLLKRERTTLEQMLPGLDESLAKIPLMEMETSGNPSIDTFKQLGGTRLLVPSEFGGIGATPLQAVRIQRAIGSRSPSLAIATTMHHFSVASIVEMVNADPQRIPLLLGAIAQESLYLASGFAEGRTGTSILSSSMAVKRTPEGLVVNGSKKPCSLSASMDLLTAAVRVETDAGPEQFAIVTVPAGAPGLERRPFWRTSALAGAESDEVVLQDVFVPNEQVFILRPEDFVFMERSFLWFELLTTASYLGIASALLERVIVAKKGTPIERTVLGTEVESAMSALEGVAAEMMAGETGNDELARMLFVRFAVQQTIRRTTASAAELLGGMAFISSPEVACLITSAGALGFHPPSRLSISSSLDAYLAGQPLEMV